MYPTGRQMTRVQGTAAGTTVISNRAGVMDGILIPANKTGTVSFFDINVASGTADGNFLFDIPCTVGSIPKFFPTGQEGMALKKGLVAVNGGTSDMNVFWD